LAVATVLAPSTLGAVTPGVTLKAPYKKATVVLTNPATVAGCGGGAIRTSAFFNKTTGIGGFSDNSSSTWCTSSTNNSASYTGRLALTLPVKFATSGMHTITVLWDTVIAGSVNLTAGTCAGSASAPYSGCTRSSEAFVYGFAYLIDKTTHKKVASNAWPGNFAYVDSYTSCRYTNCSTTSSAKSSATISGSFFWAWYWNKTAVNSTHKYVLSMTLSGGAAVVLKVSGATLSGAKADAQLNSATGGNDEQLYSVTIA